MSFCDLNHQEDKQHDSPLMCHSVKGQTQGFFKLMLAVLSWLMFYSVKAQCFCPHVLGCDEAPWLYTVIFVLFLTLLSSGTSPNTWLCFSLTLKKLHILTIHSSILHIYVFISLSFSFSLTETFVSPSWLDCPDLTACKNVSLICKLNQRRKLTAACHQINPSPR